MLNAIENAKSLPLDLISNLQEPELEVEEVERFSSNNNFGIDIIPYKVFPVIVKGSPDCFYSNSYKERQNLVQNIVEAESPIHIKELCPVSNIDFVPRDEIHNAISLVLAKEISTSWIELIPKVARIFGYQHTGKRIQDRINKQITYLLRIKKIKKSTFGLELNE